MFSRFFIDRPIFASVLSIVITLAGAVAVVSLPVAQYPLITPPSIIVQATFPGASAQVVDESVGVPIEKEVNGVEGMIYMSSQSGNDGSYRLTVTFKPGVKENFAQVLVQNRVNLALPQLPDVVKQAGVTTRKRNPDVLLIITVYSPTAAYDQLYLSNYATINVKDEVARVEGVGDITLFGQLDYSMRVWVDPDRLSSLGLTANDVVAAVREQNLQVATGTFGQQPTPVDRPFEFTVNTLGRLTETSEFENIVIRTTADGRKVRVKDVGHVTLGARNEDVLSKLDGYPSTNIAVFQLPDANAIDTARAIKAKMEELKQFFPEGVEYAIAYDTTPYVSESIHEVIHTLSEAVVLVAIVVLVFLQNWRSSLIPLVAVPVAIIGTFAAMAALGFSVNNLTMFGLVLAIGIVVDDAIVVVEAVEHHVEHGLSPREASYKAMEEVSGPVVAVALVLSAVFLPCAFLGGITGEFFRQFALTIAVSTIISAFNSLTLSPALAAILLQPKHARKDWLGRILDRTLGWFFRLFNWTFRRATNGYVRGVRLTLRASVVVLLLYGGLLLLTVWTYKRLPTGYIPVQDVGKLYATIQLPDAASLERTQAVVDHVADIVREDPGVKHTIAIAGQSFQLNANGSNFGNIFISLDAFEKRRDPSLYCDAIADRIRQRVIAEVPEAKVTILGPPPVSGLGNTGGFKIMIEDRSGDNDLAKLQDQTFTLMEAARDDPQVSGLFTVFRADSPMLFADLNREQCQNMDVNPNDVFTAMQVYLGSYYVNDLNLFGRTWQVVVQADGPFRDSVEKIKRIKVRNARGTMVPLGTVMSVREVIGPLQVNRYNMYPAAAVIGVTRPGVSSGQGIDAMKALCDRTLPTSMAYEWTEINYIQIDASKNVWNNLIFPLSVVFVFLALAALYESWALPLAVILVVPTCILGSLTGIAIARGDVNIFTQIGFVVLVGLASKNAILIVEFAKLKRSAGLSRAEATLAACQLRLRPILMTSFAFILGVVPLMLATGAGMEMRRTLGTAVFSGMLGVTGFGIFLTPVFFYVVEWVAEARLFSSERARLAGRIALFAVGILSLGLPWILVWLLGMVMVRRGRSLLGRAASPPINGTGTPHVVRVAPADVASPDSAGTPGPLSNGNGTGKGHPNGTAHANGPSPPVIPGHADDESGCIAKK